MRVSLTTTWAKTRLNEICQKEGWKVLCLVALLPPRLASV